MKRPIPSLPGYFADEDGAIWGPRCIRKPRLDRDGYARINAHSDGKVRAFWVSRLVAEAFLGPRPDGMVVRHLDGARSNNRPANLAYGTVEENLEDQKWHGTFPNKITPAEALRIRQRANAGERMTKLAEEYGLHYQHIFRIKHGLRWKELTTSP